MIGFLARFLPSRAAGQIALLVVAALVAAHVLTAIVLLVLLEREAVRLPRFPEVLQHSLVARQYAAATTPEARAVVLETAAKVLPGLERLPLDSTLEQPPLSPRDRLLLLAFQQEVGTAIEVFLLPAADADEEARKLYSVGFQFADGTSLLTRWSLRAPPPRGAFAVFVFIGTAASLVLMIALLTVWATRGLVAPLARLSDAVTRFDPDRDGEVIADRGPIEVRRLARAFNAMAQRIRRMVEERTRMLAAVSHDLRTPITRLRLRAEDIADADLGRAMLGDLALMERMTTGALAFLREGRTSGAMVAVDLPALLQTVCDDFSDLGGEVAFSGPERGSVACDPDQIARAVTNLLDNAVKFGGGAKVRLALSTETATIEVSDDGPGLPAAELERVLEPFYRADLARTLREDDGFGLGLAIVQAIARAHRGELTLASAPGQGLTAKLIWPRGAG